MEKSLPNAVNAAKTTLWQSNEAIYLNSKEKHANE